MSGLIPTKFFDCKSCIMSTVVLEKINLDKFRINFEIYQANESIESKFILTNKVVIVRTGTVIKEVNYKKDELSLFEIYFPGEIICLDPKHTNLFDMKIISLETSSLCFLNTEVIEQHKDLYSKYLKIRFNYLEDSNFFKQLLLTQRNPLKRVTLFIVTIIKKKQLIAHDNIQLKINLSRKQIGFYLGLAEETIVRSLRQLNQLELIIVNNKNFIIPSYKNLLDFFTDPIL